MEMDSIVKGKKGKDNCFRTRPRIAIYILILVSLIAAIFVSTAIIVWSLHKAPSNEARKDAQKESDDIEWPRVPDDTNHRYRFASVACADKTCSTIGVNVLAEGGTGVDAMIAVSLCLGVVRSPSSGIGGGGFMTFYNRSSNETFILDYRETAPGAANSTMYENSSLTSNIGGGSIAVPGEVAGMWEAHQRFGGLKWSRLFEPSIRLAENGWILSDYVAKIIVKNFHKLDDQLKALFTDSETGEMKKAGDTVVFSKLAQTYRRIAEGGREVFYRGDLRDAIIADLEELDGNIITAQDLEDYRLEDRKAVKSTLRNGRFTVISPPPPSGGVVVQYILNILDGYDLTPESVSPKLDKVSSTATTYHRFVEAMKFAYAARKDLGDMKFVNVTDIVANMTSKDYADQIRSKITDATTHDVQYYGAITDSRITTGTSHISILAGNGDAVSATTSVNYAWGSKRMGKRTGIIFNNLMDDFSMPGKPSWTDDAWIAPSNEANWIKPGKRPLSAMSPTVVVDEDGEVVLVTGGAGGAKIITVTAHTIINRIWFGLNLTESVSRPRLHSQLLPNSVFSEEGFPQEYLNELKKKNHNIVPFTGVTPVSDSVGYHGDIVLGVGDHRRGGAADGF